MILKLAMIFILIVSVGSTYEVFGHGIGSETLPSKNIGGKQVFIQVNAVTVPDSDIDQQFTFEMLEKKTGEAINEVTYEIKASKQDQLLFHETFESGTGTLVIDFIDKDIDQVQVEKQSAGIFSFISGGVDVVKITGPYFDYGGLYQFEIKVHTVNSFSEKLNPPAIWNAGISMADVTQYTIDDLNFGKQTFSHTTYYDLIENFQYDQKSKTISFEMPFDASFDSINQTSVVHEEVAISKEFGDLMVSEISATVNGLLMPEEVIAIDDFTEDQRIIHLTMIKNNIFELYDQDKIQNNRLDFVIGPSESELPLATATKNGQFKIVMNPVPTDIKSGGELQISYKLLDVFLKDRPVKVDYKMYVSQGQKILFQTSGVSNDKVGEFDSVKLSIPDDVTGVIYVNFENLGGNSLASAKLPIIVDRVLVEEEFKIPAWIRSNASLWSEGLISDDEFVFAMEFLIKEGIIQL